jgi:hypothetical protein
VIRHRSKSPIRFTARAPRPALSAARRIERRGSAPQMRRRPSPEGGLPAFRSPNRKLHPPSPSVVLQQIYSEDSRTSRIVNRRGLAGPPPRSAAAAMLWRCRNDSGNPATPPARAAALPRPARESRIQQQRIPDYHNCVNMPGTGRRRPSRSWPRQNGLRRRMKISQGGGHGTPVHCQPARSRLTRSRLPTMRVEA